MYQLTGALFIRLHSGYWLGPTYLQYVGMKNVKVVETTYFSSSESSVYIHTYKIHLVSAKINDYKTNTEKLQVKLYSEHESCSRVT